MNIFDVFQVDERPVTALLESVVGAPVARFSAELAPVRGGQPGDDKQWCTFRYTLLDSRSGEIEMFVKRCVWNDRKESPHYRFLEAQAVPTPRLYGALPDRRGQEVLFLARLSATGFRRDEVAEWRSLLSLLARLNACAITAEYFPHLYAYEPIGQVEQGWWISGLPPAPSEETLAARLRECGVGETDLPRLLGATADLFARVARQPKGLLHQDFVSDNFGWRDAPRMEMVVFDLHKCGYGPRFSDVTPYLGLPDWSGSTAAFLETTGLETTGLDTTGKDPLSLRDSLTQHYLTELARFGGPTVSVQTFREETALLSWAHKVSVLPWLVERQSPRVQEVLDFLCQHEPGGYPCGYGRTRILPMRAGG